MDHSPRKTFELFRKSMISKSNDWMDLLAEDVELKGPLAQVKGKNEFIAINQPFFSSILDSELLELVEKDDKVITRILTKVGLPSGKELVLEVSEWYEIKENLITSLIVYFDTDEFRKGLS